MSTKSLAAALAASAALLAAGCGNVTQGSSAALVTVQRLDAAPGATPSAFGNPLLSDVITSIKVNGVQVPTVLNDLGRVSLTLTLKNPGPDGSVTPTRLNTVTFTRYHVEYRRTDGHNVEGVDVPYSFDSGLTFALTSDGATESFEIVRDSAKQEAPLRGLRGGGGATIINTIANVTFYGTDQSGKEVVVSGSMAVNFADFADPA